MPAEPAVLEIVRARGVRRQGVDGPLFVRSRSSWTVARDTRGECVFFDRGAGGLCIIHRDVGEEALPSACRHFPRKVLHDARGTLISVSHFCPTAAEMLLTESACAIVDAHPPLLLPSDMEGLDARRALPPLLKPDLLCDIDGYDAWERAGIATLAQPGIAYSACLDHLAAATEVVRQWKPGGAPLGDRVRMAFTKTARDADGRWCQEQAIERIARLTAGSTGGDLSQTQDFDNVWKRHMAGAESGWLDRAMKNYLAARLFGNWVAYQGRGLRSIVEWVRTCAAVVHYFVLQGAAVSGLPPDRASFIEAIRSADLLLLHTLDSGAFAKDIAAAEELRHA